jgi:hypothetical protein
MATDIITVIQSKFKNRKSFTKFDLLELLKKYFPETPNKSTLGWRIHDLKTKGTINHLGRGIYSLAAKKEFRPEISVEAKQLYQIIKQSLPYTISCIIDTRWLNEFMLHQVFKSYLIIEVEKQAATVVFNRLTETGKKVFVNPGTDVFDNYINTSENVIIVKSMISESPLYEVEEVPIASMEKLLVDIICDKEIYGAQNQEAEIIFKNVIEKYNISTAKLRRYATRRNKLAEIKKLIELHTIS